MVDNKRQTPFMKAGLTDHIWTIEEVINYKIDGNGDNVTK